LQRAGFHVTGVDLYFQRNYCGEIFVCADAMGRDVRPIIERGDFDFIWASPPCQAYTNAQRLRANSHPDLVAPVRDILRSAGRPYCIENVPGSPLNDPIELCGAMFGLRTYRHRLFECSFPVKAPPHPEHKCPTVKMGRKPVDGAFMHVVGNFSGVAAAREAMGIDWMTRDELRESIPPVYSEFIARAFLAQRQAEAAPSYTKATEGR
jgi:DNA (cytosine-5)-methyltransferase 1